MSKPIIQIDCSSCGTSYRLALPNQIVERPNKSLTFRCHNCKFKWDIPPKDLLEQPDAAKTFVLTESRKKNFFAHKNLQEVKDQILQDIYEKEDTIRIFGAPWKMMGDAEELKESFADSASTPFDEKFIKNLQNEFEKLRFGLNDEVLKDFLDKNGEIFLPLFEKALQEAPYLYEMIASYANEAVNQTSIEANLWSELGPDDSNLEESLRSIIQKMLK